MAYLWQDPTQTHQVFGRRRQHVGRSSRDHQLHVPHRRWCSVLVFEETGDRFPLDNGERVRRSHARDEGSHMAPESASGGLPALRRCDDTLLGQPISHRARARPPVSRTYQAYRCMLSLYSLGGRKRHTASGLLSHCRHGRGRANKSTPFAEGKALRRVPQTPRGLKGSVVMWVCPEQTRVQDVLTVSNDSYIRFSDLRCYAFVRAFRCICTGSFPFILEQFTYIKPLLFLL